MKKFNKSRIRVLLVDVYPVVLAGVEVFLAQHPGVDVVGTATDGAQAERLTRDLQPDVIVLDAEIPGMTGLELAKRLRQDFPQVRMLIFSIHKDLGAIREVVQAGAHGYLSKDCQPVQMVEAIGRLHRGETYFAPEVAHAFLNDYVARGGDDSGEQNRELSHRELQVLERVAAGEANKHIADVLEISIRTVEKHRQRLMRKLGVHKATELVRIAIQRRLVRLDGVVRTGIGQALRPLRCAPKPLAKAGGSLIRKIS